MKTIPLKSASPELNALLDEARVEDVLVKTPDGTEFVLTVVDDFDHEVVRTRQNANLMAMLDQRFRSEESLSLDQVRQQLGL